MASQPSSQDKQAEHGTALAARLSASAGTVLAHDTSLVNIIGSQVNENRCWQGRYTKEDVYPVRELPPANPSFTGRQQELDKIRSVFWALTPDGMQAGSSGSIKTITLFGLAGAGKSEVALRYAHDHDDKYDVIIWIKAKSEADLETGASRAWDRIISRYTATWSGGPLPELYQRIALSVHLFDAQVSDFNDLKREATSGQHSIERLKAWLPGNRPWLLILDDYNEPEACKIDSLLPSTGMGHVLITSRNPSVSTTDVQIEIPPSLGESEGVELLKRTAGRLVYCCCGKLDCQHAETLVSSFGCFPLAISLIGSELREQKGSVTFRNYPNLPSSTAEPLSSKLGTIFQRLFKRLSRRARELIQLYTTAVHGAVAELHSLSLVSQDPNSGSLSIHSLVHKYAGTTVKHQEKKQLSQWAVEMVTATFDFGHNRSADQWTYERSILPHVNRCFAILLSDLTPGEGPLDVQTRKLAYRLAQTYSQLGQMKGATTLYELALRDLELRSTSDSAVIDVMNSYGICLRLEAKYEDAAKWHARAKEFIENAPPSWELSIGGSKRLKMLETELNLAAISLDQGRHGDAKKELERILEQQQEELGESDVATVKTQWQLAQVLYLMGNLGNALERFRFVYESRKNRYGDHHPTTLEAAHSISTVLEEMGEYLKALALLREVLEKQTSCLGTTHYSTLKTKNTIASLYECQGLYDEALRMSRQVMKELEDVLGTAANHPWLLRVRCGVADVELRLGKYEDARKNYTAAYEGFTTRGMMGDAWPTQINITRVLRDIGQYDAAFIRCEEALEELQKNPDIDRRFVSVAKFCKATILELQGRYEEALQLYAERFREEEEQPKPDLVEILKMRCFFGSTTTKQSRYQDALQIYNDIEEEVQKLDKSGRSIVELLAMRGKADVYLQLGRYDDALKLYQTVCSIKETSQLKDPEYYYTVYGKGRAYIEMRKFDEGLGFLQDAINGWKLIFDTADHPYIFMAMEHMGLGLLRRGEALDNRKAHSLCKQALEGCEKMLRDGHPQTCQARASLGAVLAEQNRLNEASNVYAASLRERRAEFGDYHPSTLEVRRLLADILWRRHRYWKVWWMSVTGPGGRGKALAASSIGLLLAIMTMVLAYSKFKRLSWPRHMASAMELLSRVFRN
ncbi:TPR-like protein [Canariomyces notabilis]|uniref:TPR-like protein n=1 Tax=Canariomyces notabilis TaxID=2074819 RepID=A0AAN6TF64_9PEZI|nr:TPR-like protein [Canariomyces arenarius]